MLLLYCFGSADCLPVGLSHARGARAFQTSTFETGPTVPLHGDTGNPGVKALTGATNGSP
jgi:hypothetical protein